MYGNNKLSQAAAPTLSGAGFEDVSSRQPEVYAAIDRAEGNANYLSAQLEILANRLYAVLGAQIKKVPEGAAFGYSCELAGRAGSLADRLASATFSLDDLIDRLEI